MNNGGYGVNARTGKTKRRRRVFRYDPSIKRDFGTDGGGVLTVKVDYQVTVDQLAAAWLLDLGILPEAPGAYQQVQRMASSGERRAVWQLARDYIATHPFDPTLPMGGFSREITRGGLDDLHDLTAAIFYQRFFMGTQA